MTRHDLEKEAIIIRMTGCPNGCARPYIAEIALVGRGPERYNLYLGGAFDGSRLGKLYADKGQWSLAREAFVLLAERSPETGLFRRIHDLYLVQSHLPLFIMPWTLMHAIDDVAALLPWNARALVGLSCVSHDSVLP